MKTLLTLCVLLLTAATVNAQTFDLLERPAATANPSPFDLMHQAEVARVSSPLTITAANDDEPGFDLLFVMKPKPKDVEKDVEPDFVERTGCACGCNEAGCKCDHAGTNSPPAGKPASRIVYVGATWCDPCRSSDAHTIPELIKAGVDVTKLDYDADQAKLLKPVKQLPTWWIVSPDGNVVDTLEGNPLGQSYAAELLRRLPKPDKAAATPKTYTKPNTLEARVAASAERHFVARVQGPPASLSKPGDSEKKRAEPSPSGNTTNASGSEKKSPAPSGLNTATPSASTRSPGSRS